ncbi:MAG: sensor histidine kinase RegB [Halocynthiibacter sp.]
MDRATTLFTIHERSDWITLRTFTQLRWFAVLGQVTAIFVSISLFNMQLHLGLSLVLVGTLVIANLISTYVFPRNTHLSEMMAVAILLFDMLQLSALIYLTGGLHNPFSLLIVAPVTIAATFLDWRYTMLLGAVAVTLTTILMFYFEPIRTDQGFVLRLPIVFVFGFWVAIVIGTVFQAIYARWVTLEVHKMSEALLATQTVLLREQKLTDLGGVVAAAAHELGTPLATIKLVSSELIEEFEEGSDLRTDAQLILDQAERCRQILRSMGRAGKDDMLIHRAPLSTVLEEAVEPHKDRGIKVIEDIRPRRGANPKQPIILRSPELIHGIRNLVQNAVDFAEDCVWVEARWNADHVWIRVIDDGKGFPSHFLHRLGDPFLRKRKTPSVQKRPGYEGMGLGLFIAKTLLERTGAAITFSNGYDPFLSVTERPEKCGAIVDLRWARDVLSNGVDDQAAYTGENKPFV